MREWGARPLLEVMGVMSVILVDRFHSGPMSQALDVGSLVGVHFYFCPSLSLVQNKRCPAPVVEGAAGPNCSESHSSHAVSPAFGTVGWIRNRGWVNSYVTGAVVLTIWGIVAAKCRFAAANTFLNMFLFRLYINLRSWNVLHLGK